jgi:fucose permease
MADPKTDLSPGAPGTTAATQAGAAKQNRSRYLLVLWFLGAALFVALIGWILLAMNDKEVPEAMPILCATIVGGFVGLVSSERGSNG